MDGKRHPCLVRSACFIDTTALASTSSARFGKFIMLIAPTTHNRLTANNFGKSHICVQRKAGSQELAPGWAQESNQKPVFVRVPESLDLKALEAHYGDNTLGCEKHLAIIGRITAKYAHTGRYEQDVMLPFSYDGFHYLAGNEASAILKLELGDRKDQSGKKFQHIQCDHHWRKNVKSKSYGLDQSTWGKTKAVEIKHARLAQRIRNMREDGQENPLDNRLRQQMKATTFNAKLARKLVEKQYQKDLKNPKLKEKKRHSLKRLQAGQGVATPALVDDVICDVVLWKTPKKRAKHKSPEESRDFAVACIEDIEQGQWRWKPDAMGRRHHNYSNLPKYLRKAICDEHGKSLYEIDIKNSQPLIQATFFMQCGEGVYDDEDERLRLANKIVDMACSGDNDTRLRQGPEYVYDKKGRVKVHSRQGLVRHYEDLIYRTAQIVRQHRSEFEAYLASAQSGKYYEEQGWRAKLAGDSRMWNLLKTNRSAAKARFMAMWYGMNPKKGKVSKAYKAWQAAWPNVAAVTYRWKALHFPIMAKLMQHLESNIMLGVVARSLSDLPMLVTVHDSIMCRRQDVERVKAAIEQAFPYKPKLEMSQAAEKHRAKKAKEQKTLQLPREDKDLYLASLSQKPTKQKTHIENAISPRIAHTEQPRWWTGSNEKLSNISARPGARLLSRLIPLSRGPPLVARGYIESLLRHG